jgi:hypothetical protein
MKFLYALLITFATSLCLAEDNPAIIAGYKENIISEVKSADKIFIIEHSNIHDLDAKSKSGANSKVEKTYRSLQLTTKQIEALLSQVNNFQFIEASSLCIFEPHHRIEFYKNGKNTSSIEICFQCQDIQWSKDNKTRGMLSEVFLSTVLSSGMKTERNWQELAKEKINKDEHRQ